MRHEYLDPPRTIRPFPHPGGWILNQRIRCVCEEARMVIFLAKEIHEAFDKLEKEGTIEPHKELRDMGFRSYEEFEKYQHEKAKERWINACMQITGCRNMESLERQWNLFGDIFHKYHFGNPVEWVIDPSVCPDEIKEARKHELSEAVSLMEREGKCHWRCNHDFVCFCDE